MHILVTTVVHVPLDARIHEREIRAMDAAGWDVTYAAPWSAYGQDPPDHLRAVDLPRAAGRSRVPAVRAAREVIADLESEVDLILLHDADLLAAVAGRRRRRPVVWDVHEDTAAALSDRAWVPAWSRPLVHGAVRFAERWAERRLHLILAEGAYVERFRGPHPVVPNHPRVPPAALEPGGERVVYVGRISRGRGAEEMLELGRLLGGDLEVHLVGPADDDVAPAVRAAHDRGDVAWHGFLPNDEALELVDGALAGLSLLHDDPNYRVSTPTKVLEYMARGVPVITTPLPRAERLVADNSCGTVVGFGDVQAVARVVHRLADDAHGRRRMGAAGHAAARAKYDWRTTSRRFLRLLEGWADSSA